MSQLFIRFGKSPEKVKSYNHRDDRYEAGVSAYFAEKINRHYILQLLPQSYGEIAGGISDRPLYIIDGDYIGNGSDGEPVVRVLSEKRMRGGTEYMDENGVINNIQKTIKELKKLRTEYRKTSRYWGRKPDKEYMDSEYPLN